MLDDKALKKVRSTLMGMSNIGKEAGRGKGKECCKRGVRRGKKLRTIHWFEKKSFNNRENFSPKNSYEEKKLKIAPVDVAIQQEYNQRGSHRTFSKQLSLWFLFLKLQWVYFIKYWKLWVCAAVTASSTHMNCEWFPTLDEKGVAPQSKPDLTFL